MLWKMEHLLYWSKCSIFHDILEYMIFHRHQKALLWSKGFKRYIVLSNLDVLLQVYVCCIFASICCEFMCVLCILDVRPDFFIS